MASAFSGLFPGRNMRQSGVQASSPLSEWIDACARTLDTSTHLPMSDIINASSHLTKREVCVSRETNHRPYRKNTVCIGDAANHLPNNLAQGASVAIEDGHAIGSIVALALAVRAAEEEGGTAIPMANTVTSIIDRFVQLRAPRVRDCRRVSHFTQYISDYPTLSGYMRFVPNPINSMIFDTFLNISLGGGGIQPDAVLGPETLTGGHPIRVSTEFR